MFFKKPKEKTTEEKTNEVLAQITKYEGMISRISMIVAWLDDRNIALDQIGIKDWVSGECETYDFEEIDPEGRIKSVIAVHLRERRSILKEVAGQLKSNLRDLYRNE